jgi:glycosyltransferase involved in cell wall biosynthesis
VAKGGILLMRAFARVQREFPDARLDVVAFVPRRFAAELGRIPGVSAHARLPMGELEGLYGSARALVAPFATDTLGFVVLEAFAHGTPAVVTRHFALPELVTDHVTGVVAAAGASVFDAQGRRRFPMLPAAHDGTHGHPLLDELREPAAREVDALAEGMATLLEDAETARAMGEAALAETRTGRFSHDRRRAALRAVYEDALSSA